MAKSRSKTGGYILAVLLGAIAGGTGVAVITRATPAMMSRMMSSMMGNMMMQMGEEGCDPKEI